VADESLQVAIQVARSLRPHTLEAEGRIHLVAIEQVGEGNLVQALAYAGVC
jgi:hypothetical protein